MWRAGGIVHSNSGSFKSHRHRRSLYPDLPLDGLFELRAHRRGDCGALSTAGSPGRPFGRCQLNAGNCIILTFARLDARQCGESYRTIAEALLGFRGTKTDWEGDPRKNKARRLVASGQHICGAAIERCCTTRFKLPRRLAPSLIR